ncbi:hypothetical protein [Microvirga yunnanensis]|uniref:hypothetical protein n=1 Tax=Microvirga yunnanensis TaxID=2953740 RepID=UPI0021C94D66|nr:hypothetical protein [Microvirga sp. HBU67655]
MSKPYQLPRDPRRQPVGWYSESKVTDFNPSKFVSRELAKAFKGKSLEERLQLAVEMAEKLAPHAYSVHGPSASVGEAIIVTAIKEAIEALRKVEV